MEHVRHSKTIFPMLTYLVLAKLDDGILHDLAQRMRYKQ